MVAGIFAPVPSTKSSFLKSIKSALWSLFCAKAYRIILKRDMKNTKELEVVLRRRVEEQMEES